MFTTYRIQIETRSCLLPRINLSTTLDRSTQLGSERPVTHHCQFRFTEDGGLKLQRQYRHSSPPRSPVSDFLYVDTRWCIYHFRFSMYKGIASGQCVDHTTRAEAASHSLGVASPQVCTCLEHYRPRQRR